MRQALCSCVRDVAKMTTRVAPETSRKLVLRSLARTLRDSPLFNLVFSALWMFSMAIVLGLLLTTFERDGDLATQAIARADVQLVRMA